MKRKRPTKAAKAVSKGKAKPAPVKRRGGPPAAKAKASAKREAQRQAAEAECDALAAVIVQRENEKKKPVPEAPSVKIGRRAVEALTLEEFYFPLAADIAQKYHKDLTRAEIEEQNKKSEAAQRIDRAITKGEAQILLEDVAVWMFESPDDPPFKRMVELVDPPAADKDRASMLDPWHEEEVGILFRNLPAGPKLAAGKLGEVVVGMIQKPSPDPAVEGRRPRWQMLADLMTVKTRASDGTSTRKMSKKARAWMESEVKRIIADLGNADDLGRNLVLAHSLECFEPFVVALVNELCSAKPHVRRRRLKIARWAMHNRIGGTSLYKQDGLERADMHWLKKRFKGAK